MNLNLNSKLLKTAFQDFFAPRKSYRLITAQQKKNLTLTTKKGK